MTDLGVKLAIRQDDESGMVVAYFSKSDDSERFVMGCIRTTLLDTQPGLYDRWKLVMTEAFSRELQTITGMEPAAMVEYKLHEKN